MKEMNNGVFSWKEENGRIIITKYTLPCEEVVIPEKVEGMEVSALGDYVLSGHCCRSVFLPKSVKKIGRYGFYNCRILLQRFYGYWYRSIYRLSSYPQAGYYNGSGGFLSEGDSVRGSGGALRPYKRHNGGCFVVSGIL